MWSRTASTCSTAAGSSVRAGPNWRKSSNARAMWRRRRDGLYQNPPRNGEGDRDAQRRGGGGPRSRRANSVGPLHQLRWLPSLSRGGVAMTAPFPTRKQEEWRYADLDALQPAWEQFAEPLTLIV